jgi:DNA-binding transcriptional MocR family regulator
MGGPNTWTLRRAIALAAVTAIHAGLSGSAERRVELMRERLAKGGEVANAVLRELFPRGLWLQPDDSGKFLWAVFEVGDEILRSALFDDPAYRYASGDASPPVLEKSACMVAGA